MQRDSRITDGGTIERVELFVRTSVVEEVQECITHVVEELHTLEANGVVDEFCVQTWPRRYPMCFQFGVHGTGMDMIAKYEEFKAWAATNGYSLSPFFDHYSSPDGDHLVFPIMCLALYDRDGSLDMVYPYTDDSDVAYSVKNGLTALTARADRENDSGDEDAVQAELSTAT